MIYAPCIGCGCGPILFEFCGDWTDTGHLTHLTAVECAACGIRRELTCRACVSQAKHPSNHTPENTP